jgi:hypothetical protein
MGLQMVIGSSLYASLATLVAAARLQEVNPSQYQDFLDMVCRCRL